MARKKILIIRLSSFGDVIQLLPTIDYLHQEGFDVDILTKKAFASGLTPHPHIHKIHIFDNKSFIGTELRKVKRLITENKYDVVYDAHNNLRSKLILLVTFFSRLFSKTITVQRPKYRLKRFLLFKFRINKFEKPYVSAKSFFAPLKNAGILKSDYDLENLELNPSYNQNMEELSKFNIPDFSYICLAPSAAWPLKRWPITHFQELINSMPNVSFYIIGGAEDTFTFDLKALNLTNLCGKINWYDTGKILKNAQAVISADTGVLHWADYMGTPSIGLLGPTAFGVPFRKSTKVLNLNLPCSPCTKDGRGECKITETQKCLVDIKPQAVKYEVEKILR